ncbi:MAG: hypothetical protein NC099_04875 [Corallococcus sp.]|nr:hypothetical protein [Corallococcus sp.]
MYYLQNRWKIEGKTLCYYGLRNKQDMFKNIVKLSSKQLTIIKQLPKELNENELKNVSELLGKQIVEENQLKTTPKSLNEARFCTTCVANDYIIPGLEFDGQGRCPMCQTKETLQQLKSIVPVKNRFEHSKKSRFDVAVFYTGGKDSTYLLYYLAKVLKLRVLALMWEIPFMSESAKKSLEGAKRAFDNVEFVTRKISDDDLRKIYRKLYQLQGNTCACPSLAYVMFYPDMVEAKVPYFVVGNESAQIIGLYYNRMAPKIAYSFSENKGLNDLVNLGRLLTLRPPLKKGQLHTIATMKQLAYGDNILKKLSGYRNRLISNVVCAIREVPNITVPLKRAIRRSSRSGNIPSFCQVDFNDISNGSYDWRKVKNVLTEQCGWRPPDENVKGLHTSCKIEKCKEHSQFKRFYDMESDMIPFSALELSLASRDGNVSREDALQEMKEAMGFCIDEIAECEIMKEYLQI